MINDECKELLTSIEKCFKYFTTISESDPGNNRLIKVTATDHLLEITKRYLSSNSFEYTISIRKLNCCVFKIICAYSFTQYATYEIDVYRKGSWEKYLKEELSKCEEKLNKAKEEKVRKNFSPVDDKYIFDRDEHEDRY